MGQLRTAPNPTHIEGAIQQCTWDKDVTSKGTIFSVLSDNDEFVRLEVRERRADRNYTERASITLSRDQSIELIKILSALI